jgi:hypothetical protein
MHQQFFQFQGGQQLQQQTSTTKELQNNDIVLEICNNWEFVRELFFKMMEGELKKVDNLETTWISYINSNNLDMRNYKSPEEFEEKHLKPMAEQKVAEIKK